jgi:hypothetical protein
MTLLRYPARAIGTLSLIASLTALSPAPVHGQEAGVDMRSALLAAARDEKAAQASTPQRSLVERGLYWYDNQYVLPKVFGGWKGLHFATGGFPPGAGMKFGAGFKHLMGRGSDDEARAQIDTLVARSTRGYWRAAAALQVRNPLPDSLTLRLRGERYEFPQEDFFGLGRESQRDNRTDYLQRSTEIGADLEWKPARSITLDGGVSHLDPTIARGTDPRFPSTDEVFDASTLAGWTEQPRFLRSTAGLTFDRRDNPLHPHAGGNYSVRFAQYDDRDLNTYSFRQVALDVQEYVPAPTRYRTIALRASAVLSDPFDGQQIPFYYQPTLGGSETLRGFREFRFRDRNSVALTAEYRWEASWMLDGALFVDAGTVAAERRDLSLSNLDVSYGFGFRVHSNRAFVARLDLAFSREGFIPLMRFEHVF